MIDSNLKAWFRWCPISDRQLFKFSKCFMPISVGQAVHEGNKFLATVKRINSSFEACTILVDDTIQRHTLKITQPPKNEDEEKQLYLKSLREGDEWLIRNNRYLEQFEIPLTVIRWDKWLSHPKFSSQSVVINELYTNNKYYFEAVNQSIDDFLNRFLMRQENSAANYKTAFEYCLDYIKEECTALCLWVEEECEFEVYPSGRNKAMIATYELLIKPFYPDLLRSVSLYFKKSGNGSKFLEAKNELTIFEEECA